MALLIGFGLRLWGMKQPTPFYDSPFFSENKPEIVARGGAQSEFEAYSLAAYREVLRQNPDVILGADVLLTQDKKFVVFDPDQAHRLDGEHLLRSTPFDQLESKPLTLREFVDEFSGQRLYIELHDNVQDIHELFVAELEDLDLEHQILVRSNFDLIAKAIKESRPLWLYGSGTGERTRLMALNSLYLEPLMEFFSDVYVTPVLWQKRRILTPGLVAELKRRKRRIFVEGVDSAKDLAAVGDLEVDGYITRSPLWLSKELKASGSENRGK